VVGWRQDPIAPIPDAPIHDARRACATLHDHHDLLRTWTCWRSSDRTTWNDDAFQVDARLFERAIAHANELNPAFVIICGDLVNRVGHSGQIAEFQHIASTLNPSISTLSGRYLVAISSLATTMSGTSPRRSPCAPIARPSGRNLDHS